MNPFQSIANYLDNDLYRWEDDEERKRRYDEMYPMGDAHLGEWDQLSRARVRRTPASGYQQWDQGANEASPASGYQQWDKGAGDTGPAGYDASVQDNVLETITKQTPTGTTVTKKMAPTPVGSRPSLIPGMMDKYFRDRGVGSGPTTPRTIPPFDTAPRGMESTPPTTYPDAGGMDYQRRSINDIRGDIQAEQFNQARAARAGQAASRPQPRPYTGGNVSGVPTPPMPVQSPTTYPDAGGMQIGRGMSPYQIQGMISDNERSMRSRQRPVQPSGYQQWDEISDSPMPNLGPRITQGGRTGPEPSRLNVPTGGAQYGDSAYRSWALPELPSSEDGSWSPDAIINDMTRMASGPEPITNDIYTDAVIDFVGRDAEADERGMGDWYSQMAREAIRKFNGLPADEAVTPVYKKRKASGPSKRTMNKRTTSTKSKKKQRRRVRN